jgi:sarcosine oxidase
MIRDGMNRWDLIVIGTGAVGSAALRAAGEAGARVLGLEQFTPANLRGSSHGHSRIFRHAYFEHADYVPLLRHSTARFQSLERDAATPLLHRCGVLLMGGPGSEAVRGSLDSATRWGLAVDALDAAALRARFPWFSVADDSIGSFEPDAGIVRPEASVHAALQVVRSRGGELRTTTRVLGIEEDANGVSVLTGHGTERADAVVVAAGPWAPRLLPELAPLLRVTRQVQTWVSPRPGVDASAMPCWLLDRGPELPAVYGLAPDPQAVTAHPASPSRLPKVALHGSDDLVDPDAGAAPADPHDLARVHRAYAAIAPGLAGEVVEAATCLYTMSPDGHFLVGTRRGTRRTHFAAGLSGHGFKLSPALGDALCDLALHGQTRLPIDFLSPARFD